MLMLSKGKKAQEQRAEWLVIWLAEEDSSIVVRVEMGCRAAHCSHGRE